jgi:CheY-like chemotaxis protein
MAKRILVVDDEADIVRIFREYLERMGQRVTGTTSPIEALDLVRAQPHFYDLLITDQTMPQMTGLRLSRSIHEFRPDLPTILITGDPDPPIDTERAQLANIRAILQKPITWAVLIETLSEVFPVNTPGTRSEVCPRSESPGDPMRTVK